MKNRAVHLGIMASLVPHIFCCGLPIVLSVVGLVAPESAHFHLMPESWEPWLFVVSGAMLGLSWVLVLRDCRCACDHCHGAASHRPQKVILGGVTLIFLVSIILHLLAH
ncbi:hypothetical protein HDR63_03965 [bacterium]|nr:hypothetical protein [bacterium]